MTVSSVFTSADALEMIFFHASTHASAAARIPSVAPFLAIFLIAFGQSPRDPSEKTFSGMSIPARSLRASTARSSLAVLPSASAAASRALPYTSRTSFAVVIAREVCTRIASKFV